MLLTGLTDETLLFVGWCYKLLKFIIMSYTPTIVINKKELDKHKDFFEQFYLDDNEQATIDYLKYVNNKHDVIKIGNEEIVLCCPEFSSSNRHIRDKLTELGIEYGLSN
jgi:hypothetical protein